MATLALALGIAFAAASALSASRLASSQARLLEERTTLRQTRAFLLGWTVFLLGCQETDAPLQSKPNSSVANTPNPDDTACVEAISAIATKLKKDAAGNITEVDLRKTAAGDELFTHLAGLPKVNFGYVAPLRLMNYPGQVPSGAGI